MTRTVRGPHLYQLFVIWVVVSLVTLFLSTLFLSPWHKFLIWLVTALVTFFLSLWFCDKYLGTSLIEVLFGLEGLVTEDVALLESRPRWWRGVLELLIIAFNGIVMLWPIPFHRPQSLSNRVLQGLLPLWTLTIILGGIFLVLLVVDKFWFRNEGLD